MKNKKPSKKSKFIFFRVFFNRKEIVNSLITLLTPEHSLLISKRFIFS